MSDITNILLFLCEETLITGFVFMLRAIELCFDFLQLDLFYH